MLTIIVILGMFAVFTICVVFMAKAENRLNDQLSEANASLLRLAGENQTLSFALLQYMDCVINDAVTIRNMTASVEALSSQLDEYAVAHAKAVLGGTEVHYVALPLDEV